MNQKNMRAAHSYSGIIKVAITLAIALSFGLACTSTTAYAKKKRKVKYGQIEITTNPGGFPLRIDGKPEGNTSTDVRVIELEPGHHNIEIMLPNGGRWVRDFEIERGRKLCVNVIHRYQISLPLSGESFCAGKCERWRFDHVHI